VRKIIVKHRSTRGICTYHSGATRIAALSELDVFAILPSFDLKNKSSDRLRMRTKSGYARFASLSRFLFRGVLSSSIAALFVELRRRRRRDVEKYEIPQGVRTQQMRRTEAPGMTRLGLEFIKKSSSASLCFISINDEVKDEDFHVQEP